MRFLVALFLIAQSLCFFNLCGGLKCRVTLCLSGLNLHLSVRALNFSGFRPNSFEFVVGSSGIEPPTSRLSGVRSNRLSYEPTFTWLEAC